MRPAARSSTGSASRAGGAGGGMNFYTDDSPGLKMSPVRTLRGAALQPWNPTARQCMYGIKGTGLVMLAIRGM